MTLKSPTKLAVIEAKKKTAKEMYDNNYPLREIGEALGMSHTWVWSAVRELSTDKDLTENEQ